MIPKRFLGVSVRTWRLASGVISVLLAMLCVPFFFIDPAIYITICAAFVISLSIYSISSIILQVDTDFFHNAITTIVGIVGVWAVILTIGARLGGDPLGRDQPLYILVGGSAALTGLDIARRNSDE